MAGEISQPGHENGASILFGIHGDSLRQFKQRHNLDQDSGILPYISQCFTSVCCQSWSEDAARDVLSLFSGWKESRDPNSPDVQTLSIPTAHPLPPLIGNVVNTASEKSLFVEFLAHMITSEGSQPSWLEHSLPATHKTPVKHELQHREDDSSRSQAPMQQHQNASLASSAAEASEITLNGAQAATEHCAGTPQDTEAVPAHMTPWVCPSQVQQGPQAQFQLPESSVIAPEAAAALESSSAAAADALHGILVQVAASRGEDTTSFVQKALKDPSIMQEALMHAQHSAVAQQIAQLESYSASSEQLFGTAAHPHPVTGLEPHENSAAASAGHQSLQHRLQPTSHQTKSNHRNAENGKTQQDINSQNGVNGIITPKPPNTPKPHLRTVRLSVSCCVPVPTPAVEVARGVAERGTDGHACARIDNVHALQPFLKEIDVGNSRTLVIDAYVGHCRTSTPHACTALSANAGDWQWYGLQLPVYLRHSETPVATQDNSTPVDTSSVATGGNTDLQQLVAEVPCGLHHSAVMPALGQGFAVFCMHMSGVPVVLLCVVPSIEASAVAPVDTAQQGPPNACADGVMHAAHAEHSPIPHAYQEEDNTAVAVPPPHEDCPGTAGVGGGGVPVAQDSAVPVSDNAYAACKVTQDDEDEGDCEITAAIVQLVKFKRNKYVQKKSPQAWRIEPHLPRDIAGDASDAIGRTRLSGYGLIKSATRGGVFRELLVCSTGEKWWSCLPPPLSLQLQQDLDLGRKLRDEGTLKHVTCAAAAQERGFLFPKLWADIQAYLSKLEEPWLTTLLRRGWRIGADAAPGAVIAVERVLNAQHGVSGGDMEAVGGSEGREASVAADDDVTCATPDPPRGENIPVGTDTVPPPPDMHATEAPVDTSHLPEPPSVSPSSDPSQVNHMHADDAYAMHSVEDLDAHTHAYDHNMDMHGDPAQDCELPRYRHDDAIMHERSAALETAAQPNTHAHREATHEGTMHAAHVPKAGGGDVSGAPATIEGVAEGWQHTKGALIQSFTAQGGAKGAAGGEWQHLLRGGVAGGQVQPGPTLLQSAAAEALAAHHARLAAAAAAAATEHHAAVAAHDAAAAATAAARQALEDAERAQHATASALDAATARARVAADLGLELSKDAQALAAAVPAESLRAKLPLTITPSFDTLLATPPNPPAANPLHHDVMSFYHPALYNPLLCTAEQLGLSEEQRNTYLALFEPFGLDKATAAAGLEGDPEAVARTNVVFTAWLEAQVRAHSSPNTPSNPPSTPSAKPPSTAPPKPPRPTAVASTSAPPHDLHEYHANASAPADTSTHRRHRNGHSRAMHEHDAHGNLQNDDHACGYYGDSADPSGMNRSIYLDKHGLPFVINVDGTHTYLDPQKDEAAAAALGYVLEHGEEDFEDDDDDGLLTDDEDVRERHYAALAMHGAATAAAAAAAAANGSMGYYSEPPNGGAGGGVRRGPPRGGGKGMYSAGGGGHEHSTPPRRGGAGGGAPQRRTSQRSRELSSRLKDAVLDSGRSEEEPQKLLSDVEVTRSGRKRRRPVTELM